MPDGGADRAAASIENVTRNEQQKINGIRATNKQEREEDDNQGPPLRLLERLLQPELTNQTSEKNNRATNHLPDGNGNPEEADKHNEGSKAIANSGPENLVVNTLLRSSVFRIPKRYLFG